MLGLIIAFGTAVLGLPLCAAKKPFDTVSIREKFSTTLEAPLRVSVTKSIPKETFLEPTGVVLPSPTLTTCDLSKSFYVSPVLS